MKPKMINESLRVMRLYWRKSQAELADELEISQSYLSEIERGHKDVTIDILERYSKRLGVPISTILIFAEEMEGAPPPNKGRLFLASKALDLLKLLLPNELDPIKN